MYIDYYNNEDIGFDYTIDVVAGVLYRREVEDNFLTMTQTGKPANSLGNYCRIDSVLLDTYLSKLSVDFSYSKHEGVETLLRHYKDMLQRIEK